MVLVLCSKERVIGIGMPLISLREGTEVEVVKWGLEWMIPCSHKNYTFT